MPYIEQSKRTNVNMIFLDKAITETITEETVAGDLEYIFTLILIRYLRSKGLSHDHIEDVVGAFDGAKAEFQRRVVGPYEDRKKNENGDVYPTEFLEPSWRPRRPGI